MINTGMTNEQYGWYYGDGGGDTNISRIASSYLSPGRNLEDIVDELNEQCEILKTENKHLADMYLQMEMKLNELEERLNESDK